MKHHIIPAILSGGAGARLWPVSTSARPKQFHALAGPNTLFADTLARLQGAHEAFSFAPPLVLTGALHADAVRAELARAGVDGATIVLEPAARNTAAAAAAAAAIAADIDGEALVLLAPADHVIADGAAFRATIARAAAHADERIVTFGITPDRPETGYGYIKSGAALGEGVFAIDAFKEKPDAKTARAYFEAGGYSWNAGLFLFRPNVLLREFGADAQSAAIRDAAVAAVASARRSEGALALDAAHFAAAPSLPLDIAVMEKTRMGAVAPCAIGWADIGSWSEIWRLTPHDEAGNAKHGAVIAQGAHNNLLRGDGVTLCVAGVSDLIIVATPEAVIVLPRERAQDVKALREAALKLKP